MTFFTLGDHHNFAILEVGGDANKSLDGIGVDHFAFKLSGGMTELAAAKEQLEASGVEVMPVDHNVSYSLYFHDPDKNRLEIYIDVVAGWEADERLILTDAKRLSFESVQ